MGLVEHLWDSWLLWSLALLDIVVRLWLMCRVIMRRVSVPVSLAWLILLVFLPFVSEFFYLLFGEKRLGARKALKVNAAGRIQSRLAMAQWGARVGATFEKNPTHAAIANLCSAVGSFPPVGGNVVELMDDASQVLARITADIARARRHCHLLYYIWQSSGGSVMVSEALIAAAKRGVKCRVLVDAVGSQSFLRSEMYRSLVEGGVRVVVALPVNALRMLLARIDLRNHRKITVIDGGIAYCGSQNMADESFRAKRSKRLGPWIDTTARLEGPGVHALQTIFLRDWGYDSDEEMGDLAEYFPHCPMVPEGSVVQVVPSGPGVAAPHAIHQVLLAMLHAAHEEIIMTTPYFVPDEAMMAALINAALRGVRVTLVVPDKLDAMLVAAASRSHFEELLEVGVTIMQHEEGLLHAKTATIDRSLCLVTSANIDIRSFWLNFEASMVVYDKDVTGMMRMLQTKYISESKQLFVDEWRKRPLWMRFADNVAQLWGPLL